MGAALVVARDDGLYLVRDDTPPRRFGEGAGASAGDGALPVELVTSLEALGPAAEVRALGAGLDRALARRLGRPIRSGDARDWHAALRALPRANPASERARLLARARADLEAELRSPSEILVSLAREEERFERAVGREQRAAETFVAVEGTVLAEHAAAWTRTRELLVAQHRELVRRLEAEAWRTVPNLSAIVGPKVAARLIAAAGGLAPLARISSARLQLLGSRRRPNPERGPRYGVLYRAEGAETLPLDRRGAFARSVAALAAIAARADAFTHADLSAGLRRRRDARAEQLRRRRR